MLIIIVRHNLYILEYAIKKTDVFYIESEPEVF